MSNISTLLAKETFKHQIFPKLLEVIEELPSWQARADQLNAEGVRTYIGRQWTRQNLHLTFKQYWQNKEHRYSWNEHGRVIKQLHNLTH